MTSLPLTGQKLRKTIAIIFAVLSVAVPRAAAQTDDQVNAEFRSIAGRFGVELPQTYSNYDAGVSLDLPSQRFVVNIYRWNITSGQFSISYATSATDLENRASQLLAEFRERLRKQDGKLVKERLIDLDGHPGLEVVSEVKDFLIINQILLVKHRLYYLTLSLNSSQRASANDALKSFNSFHLLSPDAIEAEQKKVLSSFIPQAMAQEPFVKRPTTDWQDEGLVGKVRELIVERQDDLASAASDKYRVSQVEFNERGDRLSAVEYRSGVPAIAFAYGYAKGKRVASLAGTPNPVVVVWEGKVEPTKWNQTRKVITDTLKFEYRYNNAGQLLERWILQKDGQEYERSVRDLAKKKIEVSYGRYSRKYTYLLDDKGNPIEKSFESAETELDSHLFDARAVTTFSTIRESYVYEFDSQGNWIKQIASRTAKKNGKIISLPSHTTYRRITYF